MQRKMLPLVMGVSLIVSAIMSILVAKFLHDIYEQFQSARIEHNSQIQRRSPDDIVLSIAEANRIIERSTRPFREQNLVGTSNVANNTKRFFFNSKLRILSVETKNNCLFFPCRKQITKFFCKQKSSFVTTERKIRMILFIRLPKPQIKYIFSWSKWNLLKKLKM